MDCGLDIKGYNDFVEYIKNVNGNDVSTAAKLISVLESESFLSDFKAVIENLAPAQAYDVLVQFYNIKFPDVNNSINGNYKTNKTKGSFDSVIHRQMGLRHGSNILSAAYVAVNKKNLGKNYKVKDYIELAKAKIYNIAQARFVLFNKLANPLDKETIKDIRHDNTLTNDQKIVKCLNLSLNATDRFWASMLEEAYSNTKNFFDDIRLDSRLQVLNRNLANEEWDFEEHPQFGEIVDELDKYTEGWEGHLGDYVTAMKHIDNFIRSYFNSLKKLRSTVTKEGTREVVNKETGKKETESYTIYDYDIDNIAGEADTMNAEECVAMLFKFADTTNATTFVNSIRQIANNHAGFEALIQLADELEKDSDMKYFFFTTFGKEIMSKAEVTWQDGHFISRTSNQNSDKQTAFRNEMLNTVRHTVLSSDTGIYSNKLAKLKVLFNGIEKKDISGYNKLIETKERLEAQLSKETDKTQIEEKQKRLDSVNKRINEIQDEISIGLNEIFKAFLPIIDDGAVDSYLFSNSRYAQHVTSLFNDLEKLIAEAGRSSDNQANISRERSKLIHERKTASNPDNYEDGSVDQGLINDINRRLTETLKQEYITDKLKDIVNDLSNALLPFTSVKSELNSRDVHGNLSSDVLNNNMISFLKHTFRDEASLEILLEDRLRFGDNKQYEFSNIFIERGDHSNPDSYGLFYWDGGWKNGKGQGTLRRTSYAMDLVRFQQFIGATNNETDSSANYAEISKGDFVASAFVSFFNPERSYTKQNIPFANYFFRTQSDAPHTFIMRGQRYSIQGLYEIANAAEIKTMSDHAIGQFHVTTERYNGNGYNVSTPEKVARHFTSKDFGDLPLGDKIGRYFVGKTPKVGEEGTIRLTYSTKNDKYNYYMKGTLVQRNGRYYFTSSNDEPLKISSIDDPTLMPKEIRDAIYRIHNREFARNNQIQYTINRNHNAFQVVKNMAVQEFNDAANAITTLFVLNDDGTVKFEHDEETGTEKPQLKEEYKGNGILRTYDVYHHNKDKYGKITATKKNGVWVDGEGDGIIALCTESHDGYIAGTWYLTGRVFESDKFTLYKDLEQGEVINNYGNDLQTRGYFDFLYGGINNTNLKIKYQKLDGGQVKFLGIDFTQAQSDAIDDMIEKYLIDYSVEVNRRMRGIENFLPESYANTDNYLEFAINYHIAYNNFNDLLEGDTKFYKDAQDVLKRAKEDQAGGIPYGLTDYRRNPNRPIEDIVSSLDADDVRVQGRKVRLRTGFNAITIKNTVRQSEDSKAVIDRLEERFKNQKMSNGEKMYTDEEAHALAKSFNKAFSRVKTNDAQSYITFEEWIRRITAMGQYKRYKSLIDGLTGKRPLKNSDINEFVQVQKNFYYDLHYNKEFGIVVPRQIKNAEFVLIPQFIEGTDLEKVYNFMVNNDIDQLNTQETSKAGKANVMTIWNEDGIITDRSWGQFWLDYNSCPEAREQFSYNNLYKQQDVPQHVDATNKAGIQLMKKITDNIPETGHRLSDAKKRFYELYTRNIQQAFVGLTRSLNMLTDENGNLKLDEYGKLSYDKAVLYKKLKDEAKRLGVSSNELEYLELEEDGVTPKMPAYFTIFANKLESIVQSMFNNAITRQTLPGFHAAQVTGVGIATKWKGKEGEIISSNSLRYHPNGENYIEVIIPRPAALDGIKDEDIFRVGEDGMNMLERAGLDKFIGYRIPTEGKQSIAVMKIVGFLDKSQGSTIIVPDDWVAQTGADFDVDSIYAVMNTIRTDRKGNITSIKYTTDDNSALGRYSRYIDQAYKEFNKIYDDSADSTERRQQLDAIKNKFKNTVEQRSKEFEDAFEEYIEQDSELYSNLTFDEKREVQKYLRTDEDYATRVNNLIEALDAEADDSNLGRFRDLYKDIAQLLEDYDAEIDFQWSARNNNLRSKAAELKLKHLENKAADLGLPNFEDFKKLDFDIQNTKEARDAEILKIMMEIAEDDEFLEETLSSSNFRKVVGARDTMQSRKDKVKRKARSPYNFFDQADYQEEVMSGAKLKALSVIRDTFCSVGNKTHAEMAESVTVIYNAKDYKYEHLVDAYGSNVDVIKDNNQKVVAYKVRHNKIGWSLNNRNVEGDFITVYTSQTTAHHLDAVKEGGIPNLNELTFGVYKTFPDIGSDYMTGVGFIMQPGVARIVDAYNRSNSIFQKDYNKVFVENAIKKLAMDMKLKTVDNKKIDYYTPIYEVMKAFESTYGNYFRDIILKDLRVDSDTIKNFTLDLDNVTASKIPFNKDMMKARLDESGIFEISPVEGIEAHELRGLYDLATIMQYYRMSDIAENIGNYARLLSPDKFGAKQTLFATNKIFRDIENVRESKFLRVVQADGHSIDLLDSVYPGIENGIESYIQDSNNNSSYPSLHYFLKYASATSVILGRELFETQNEVFDDAIREIADHLGVTITEDLYNDFRGYVFGHLLQKGPLSNVDGAEEEIDRVFGYGLPLSVKFEPKNINVATDEDKAIFEKFSPAQKILWIQTHFRDSGIFKYLSCNVFNSQAVKGELSPHTIRFDNDNVNIEVALDEFSKCYNNNNWYIQNAAEDLVYYSMFVEAFKMRRNGVSRIIANDAIRDMGILEFVNIAKADVLNRLFETDEIYTQYIRSHPEKVRKIKNWKDSKGRFVFRVSDNNRILDMGSIAQADESNPTIGMELGIVDTSGDYVTYPRYIRISTNNNEVLYKAIETDNGMLYYIPLPVLESNEHGRWSANQSNNSGYATEQWYIRKVQELAGIIDEQVEMTKEDKYQRRRQADVEVIFDINRPNKLVEGGFKQAIDDINKHFITGYEGPLYIRNGALAGRGGINKRFIRNSTTQWIEGPNGGRWYDIRFIKPNKKVPKVKHGRSLNSYLRFANLDIESGNESFNRLIEDARNKGYETMNDMFMVTPHRENNVRHSTVEDFDSDELFLDTAIANINAERYSGDSAARKTSSRLRNAGINRNEVNTIKGHIGKASTIVRDYIVNKSKAMIDKINDYDFEGNAMDSEAVMERIKTDDDFRKDFVKFCCEVNSFINNYDSILQLNTTSEDPEVAYNYEEIRKALRQLKSNDGTFANANRQFVKTWLSGLSTDPLIQSDLLMLTDGYNNVGRLESWITDAEEAGIPLMQVIFKEVTNDIRGKEMLGKDAAREYSAKIKELARNTTINYDHIIDKYGRFIQHYTQALRDDLGKYVQARQNARNSEEGISSMDYIKADYEYRKFLNDNFEQPYVKSYYDETLDNEKEMLENYPEIYHEYIKLNNQRIDILRSVDEGNLPEEKKRELHIIKQKITALTSPTMDYVNDEGEYVIKSIAKPSNKLTTNKVVNKEASEALKKYIDTKNDISNKYFEKSELEGFQEILAKNIRTIARFEDRDPNGVPRKPISLIDSQEYLQAKEWMYNNATLVLNDDLKKVIDEAYNLLKETETRKSYDNILSKFNVYDRFGIPDGTKLTPDQINAIKKEQERFYGYSDTDTYSEGLITNKKGDGLVFNKEWRKNLGVASVGIKNVKYKELADQINFILKKCYDREKGIVNTSKLSIDDLKTLSNLYDKIADIKKVKRTKSAGKRLYSFIKKNVEFVPDNEIYEREYDNAKRRNLDEPGYLDAWLDANSEIVESEDGTQTNQPSRFLYTYAVPKGMEYEIHRNEDGVITDITGNEVFEKYVDVPRTRGIKTLTEWTHKVKTEYYDNYKEKMQRELTPKEYNEWYERNHIYNPITHETEPIRCWVTTEYANANLKAAVSGLDSGQHGYHYEASNNRQSRIIKKEYSNDSSTGGQYKKNRGVLVNYRSGSNPIYDNRIEATPEELAVRDHMIETLNKYTTVERAKKKVDKGYLPSLIKGREFGKDYKEDAKWFAQQFGGIFGVTDDRKFKGFTEDVDYGNDFMPEFPMMQQLKNKEYKQLENNPKPKREKYTSDEDYEAAVKKYKEIQEMNEKIAEKNREIHASLIDRDYDKVMEEFITRASRYNAVQDNKYLLYFGLNTLRGMKAFRDPAGKNKYTRDKKLSAKDRAVYETEKYNDAVKVYETFVRRILFDQFKKDNGFLTKIANVVQNHSSAKFMMLNTTGGIANVTYGETQIGMEAIAKQYFKKSEWVRGQALWMQASPSYLANAFQPTASTKGDAVIKFFNVVDFAKVNDFVDNGVTGALAKFRDTLYIEQSAGEHMMQNGVLFSMLVSHRLDTRNGNEHPIIVNEALMRRYAEEDAFKELIKNNNLGVDLNNFYKTIKNDPNLMKEYAHRHRFKDSDFLMRFNIDTRKKLIKEYNELKERNIEKYLKDFNNMPIIYDQLALGKDGYMKFVDDSILANMDKRDAYKLMAEFKDKVQAVNKKIHGWYDKIGGARLEQEWCGNLVMQYHKHIYPGIMKRYRWEGYYNEERQSVEKGCFTSLVDFLRVPLDKNFAEAIGMSKESLDTMKGIQNGFKYISNMFSTYKLYWNVIPNEEKANIRRNVADALGFLSAVAMATAVRLAADEKDKDSIWYNLLIYSADRLATESLMFTPWGAVNEAKVLWRSPIAAQSTFEDGIKFMGLISDFLLQGEDFDPYYHTGIHRGERKDYVWLLRQVPIYRGINSVRMLSKKNTFYKLEKNYNQDIAKIIADYIKGNKGEMNW